MRFSLRQLQVFATIGATDNVTRAAEKLGMSQSAASTALAELERQFGHPLFDRHGKRLKLNEIGRTALPKALELLDRATEMEGLLAGMSGPGTLRLGASLTIGNYLCPRLTERYRELYVSGEVKLEIGNSSTIADRVADFDLDLGLIEGQVTHPDLMLTDWTGDRLVVFCSPRHPLARKDGASIDHVLAEHWVVRESGSGTRQALELAMTPYWGRWKIALELEHTEAIKSTVAAGRSIGCLSQFALRDALESGSLVEIKITELNLNRRFYFVLNRQKYRTPGIEAFLNLCRQIAPAEL